MDLNTKSRLAAATLLALTLAPAAVLAGDTAEDKIARAMTSAPAEDK